MEVHVIKYYRFPYKTRKPASFYLMKHRSVLRLDFLLNVIPPMTFCNLQTLTFLASPTVLPTLMQEVVG